MSNEFYIYLNIIIYLALSAVVTYGSCRVLAWDKYLAKIEDEMEEEF